MFTQKAHDEMGKLIKKSRVKAGLTQAALARALKYKSPQFISNWERGKSLPPVTALPDIAKHIKVIPKDFKNILMVDFQRHLDKLF